MRGARMVAWLTAAVTATAAAVAVSASASGTAPAPQTRTPSAGESGVHVRFRPGRQAGKVEIVNQNRRGRASALALVGINARSGSWALPRTKGTDFDEPSVWRRIGGGSLCWAETPEEASASYTVRNPEVPFPAPPGPWRWSTVVVFTHGASSPVIARRPHPGDAFLLTGDVRRVIACVRPWLAPAGGATSTRTGNGKAEKVTICHRTGSESNPYNLITVAPDSITKQGHDTHTGPLYPEPEWGDVIAPFPGYPGMNWPAGQALLDDGCEVTGDPGDPPGIAVDPPDPDEPPVPIDPPIIIGPPTPGPTDSPRPTATSGSPNPTTGTPTPTVTSGSPTSPQTPEPSPTDASTTSPAPSTSQAPSTSPAPSTSQAPSSSQATGTITNGSPPSGTQTNTPAPTGGTVITQEPDPTYSQPAPGDIDFVLTDGWHRIVLTVDRTFLTALLKRSGPCGTGATAHNRALPMGC